MDAEKVAEPNRTRNSQLSCILQSVRRLLFRQKAPVRALVLGSDLHGTRYEGTQAAVAALAHAFKEPAILTGEQMTIRLEQRGPEFPAVYAYRSLEHALEGRYCALIVWGRGL